MYSFQMWSTEGISDFTSVSLSLKVNIWLWEKIPMDYRMLSLIVSMLFYCLHAEMVVSKELPKS